MEEDNKVNIDSEKKEENGAQQQSIKKITKINSNSKNPNTKTPLKSKLPVKTENDINQNSLVNQLFVAKPKDLSYFNQFAGFFNKNFNLTTFKKERQESRSLSKSPQRIRLPHQIRGNGIPKTIKERLAFLKKTFEDEKFLKAYAKCPKRNDSTFEDLCDYIVNYAKKYTVINAIYLSYYFICHEITYDYEFKERDEDFKISQQAESVYESGLGLSLGFTNIFEAILKKLDVRFRHIEGYCKYLPKDNNSSNNNSNSPKKNNENKNNVSFTMYNNSTNSSAILNNSKSNSNKFFDMYEPETENVYDCINHCWDSFWYKGEWYLVDTLFGSGSIEIEDKIKDANQIKSKNPEENFNMFYILAWPNYLIFSHFPCEDNWQLSDKIWTFKQFLNKCNVDYPKFYKGILKYNVEVLTHKEPLIQITNKDNLVISLKVPEYIIEGNLYNAGNGQKISEVKFSFDQRDRIFTLEPTFPKPGEFILRINLRAISSTDLSYRPLFDYRIKVINSSLYSHFEKYSTKSERFEKDKMFDVILPKIGGKNPNAHHSINFHKIINDYKKVFPPKSIKRVCYDNEGFYLFEPRSGYIRKGILTKFRVRIKGVINASLLDGSKWMNLKKTEDDVYEGQKMIETENVSICCLRGRNVFTEVFKFKPRKNKYENINSQNNNHSVNKRF
jgi:hypothetical protein